MNNYRSFKKTIIQGLDTDSGYSSDFEDIQRQNNEQRNPPNQSINYYSNEKAEETEKNEENDQNQYAGCSEDTIELLKTRYTFNNPVKRLLAIWSSIYV